MNTVIPQADRHDRFNSMSISTIRSIGKPGYYPGSAGLSPCPSCRGRHSPQHRHASRISGALRTSGASGGHMSHITRATGCG